MVGCGFESLRDIRGAVVFSGESRMGGAVGSQTEGSGVGSAAMGNAPSIHIAGPGRLVCRDGWHEFLFPCFADPDDEGRLVIVPEPSSRSIRLFLGTYRVAAGFTAAERERVVPRLAAFRTARFSSTRLFELPQAEEAAFQFHPELFEERTRAMKALAERGLTLFSGFSSVDLAHDRFGLEVSGIQQEESLERIAQALQGKFPHWHFCKTCRRDTERDPGWRFGIYMLASRQAGSC